MARFWTGVVALVAIAFGAGACSSGSNTMGAIGTGGKPASGSGGANTGSGGASAGSGGANAGSGGASAASGGASADLDGAAGDVVGDGGTDARAVERLATFSTAGDLEGFQLNSYSDVNNLGDATRDGGVLAMLAWDGEEGTPDKGALKVTAAYDDFGQFVIVQHDFTDLALQDWTGRKLHISLKIAGGFSAGGAVKVFVQDQIAGTDGGPATYPYADQYQTAAPGTDWQEFTFDIASATYRSADWDDRSITQVRWFGVNINAGVAPLDADGGVKPTPATFYIDNIWLE